MSVVTTEENFQRVFISPGSRVRRANRENYNLNVRPIPANFIPNPCLPRRFENRRAPILRSNSGNYQFNLRISPDVLVDAEGTRTTISGRAPLLFSRSNLSFFLRPISADPSADENFRRIVFPDKMPRTPRANPRNYTIHREGPIPDDFVQVDIFQGRIIFQQPVRVPRRQGRFFVVTPAPTSLGLNCITWHNQCFSSPHISGEAFSSPYISDEGFTSPEISGQDFCPCENC